MECSKKPKRSGKACHIQRRKYRQSHQKPTASVFSNSSPAIRRVRKRPNEKNIACRVKMVVSATPLSSSPAGPLTTRPKERRNRARTRRIVPSEPSPPPVAPPPSAPTVSQALHYRSSRRQARQAVPVAGAATEASARRILQRERHHHPLLQTNPHVLPRHRQKRMILLV